MKKVFILALLGILSLSLLAGVMAETAAPVAETTAPAVETAVTAPTLDAAELDALLALNLESGKTFSQALDELGILDAFKAAQPREQIQMIHAQLLLGKLTRADVLLLQETLVKAVYGDANGAGFMNGRNFNDGAPFGNRGGRNGRQGNRQGGMMGNRGGMMGGRNGMMGGWGQGQAQDGTLCPNCQNCPYAETTPEATVTP